MEQLEISSEKHKDLLWQQTCFIIQAIDDKRKSMCPGENKAMTVQWTVMLLTVSKCQPRNMFWVCDTGDFIITYKTENKIVFFFTVSEVGFPSVCCDQH